MQNQTPKKGNHQNIFSNQARKNANVSVFFKILMPDPLF
jgi:hypothetical protein